MAACFTGLWIETHEADDAVHEVSALCRDEDWRLATWDVDRGLSVVGSGAVDDATDPLAVVRSLPSLADEAPTTLLVLHNFHRFLGSPEIAQTVARQITEGKQQRMFVVVLSPVVDIPIELQRAFTVLEHPLPDAEQLRAIARGVACDEGDADDDLEPIVRVAAGLTRSEAENAFALSLVRHGRLNACDVFELKAASLKKAGLLTVHRGGETFADLGGLDAIKGFCKTVLDPARATAVTPRGILLLGVPGTGKSAFAKALGNEVGRPVLHLDVGRLMGSLVGQSEANVRSALAIADAMAPAILFVDEIEKALAGASGSSDSGVSARLFGSLLTWLSDHTSDVFFIGTANDVSRLPPEFTRAGRFDGVYFLDLPSSAERAAIWSKYLQAYGLDADQPRPRDADWTGAEIQSCCRLAAMLDVPLTDAAKHVVPIAQTAAEQIDRLRSWASGRCLSAHAGGIYQRTGGTSSRRRVTTNN